MRFDAIRIHNLGPFRDVALDLASIPGKLVAVAGPNGAGKSTLLELLPAAMFRQTPTRGSLSDLATARDASLEVSLTNGAPWTLRHLVDGVSKKGEAVVLDAAGAAVVASGKVKEADAWVASHLPAPEVLYASIFAAQGSGGFLKMKPSERKSVLLRVIGIEHLERLAEDARERARSAKAAAATLAARIADERARGGDAGAAERDLEAARKAAVSAEGELAVARSRLTALEQAAEEVRKAAAEAERIVAARRAIADRIAVAGARARDLEGRLANNRALLVDAEAIRDAVARSSVLVAERDRIAAERTAIERAGVDDRNRSRDAEERRRRADARAAAAEARARTAEVRAAAARDEVAAAEAALPALREDLERAKAAATALANEESVLRAQRLAGAEDRIRSLREALDDIASTSIPISSATGHAREALDADDAAATAAVEVPAKLADVERRFVSADLALRDVEARITKVERALARKADADAAHEERVAAEGERAAAVADRDAAQAEIDGYVARSHDRERAIATIGSRIDVVEREIAELAPLVAKADRLATAEGRIAELEPQLEATRAELAAAEAELAATPAPAVVPTPPDLVPARRAVEDAERAARAAEAAIAVREAAVAHARAAAERLDQLGAELRGVDEDLADWTLLADSLGKDGIQSAEIDAAGPELTALVNDLLHRCVGPRWTVTIDTQKLSADGKRTLEGCEVRVLDTERGREAPAETLSGGERVLVGEAVSLALAMLACRRSGVQGPTLVRDESGAALDPTNARAYVAMLRRAADIVGASHVLFVSHAVEVQELADARIEVGGGTARVAS